MRRAVAAFDALATPHGVDRYLELVRPTWSSTEIRARVVGVSRATPDSVTLTLRPNGNWTGFTAGQHTQLTTEIDGVRQTRCYSMANSALDTNGTIELSVKAHPHGLVSQHLRATAADGLTVGLSPAQGSFTLPDTEPQRLLLISGGSGITPVMSMLRTRCARGWTRPVTFLHFAPTADQMIYRPELAALTENHENLRVVTVFTDAPGTSDLDGFLSEEQLGAADGGWRASETFVCGPPPLMEAARAIFESAGRSEHLHTEAFTLAQFVAEAGAVNGSICFAGTAQTVDNDGRPILVQAESAGLAPQSGCRMGICHTCTRRLCSGVVRDAVTGALTDGPDVDIRICVSVPVGDVEIDL
jgi:ferredoxin-NADP reductase